MTRQDLEKLGVFANDMRDFIRSQGINVTDEEFAIWLDISLALAPLVYGPFESLAGGVRHE